ncbi:MAG: hypothetical protein ACRDBO_03395 [Lachnospiraceae bacterium]
MIQFAPDPRGTITSNGYIMRIDRALVEETSAPGTTPRFLVVSYAVHKANDIISIETLRLNVDSSTLIMNSFGMQIRFEDIQPGTWTDVRFSPMMTRSIPPQAQAFLIITERNVQQPQSSVTTDKVASVDPANNLLYTGNPRDINSQTRFVVTNTTMITDRRGNQIPLRSIRPGQMVRITHANFQTASIPPQTTAFVIELI